MKPEAQRIAIAEACPAVAMIDGAGVPVWRDRREYAESSSRPQRMEFDPLEDLNAMHEAEKVLTATDTGWDYIKNLRAVTLELPWCATATQRAEAFLRTIGKWEESP